jgi:hypothetical protein
MTHHGPHVTGAACMYCAGDQSYANVQYTSDGMLCVCTFCNAGDKALDCHNLDAQHALWPRQPNGTGIRL